jgi:HAD superfamily hydrolase (TIGR01509 family)
MFSGKKAIFWDNDGILVDTEKYYFEANQKILAKTGLILTKEMYTELYLTRAKGAWHLLDPKIYSELDIENLRKERDSLYNEMLLTREIIMEGIESLLMAMTGKYRMAIVTSSKTRHFNSIHSRTGLLKYFEFVITADDYTRFKPDPEPYLTAIQRIGVTSQEGIAVEDSRRGLLAAKAAGLDCIIVKNELTESCDFTEADCVLDHIGELRKVLL